MIKLEGDSENVVYLAPDTRDATIMIFTYSSSPILELKLRRLSDRELPDTTFVEFVSSSPYDIETKYKIVLTWLHDNTSGEYKIYAKNTYSMLATKTFHILKVKGQSFKMTYTMTSQPSGS